MYFVVMCLALTAHPLFIRLLCMHCMVKKN